MDLINQLKMNRRRPLRAKLIFNAGSGRPEESPQQLTSILAAMQDEQILPEVYTVRPESNLEAVVHDALKAGIRLIVVAGGDGTIDSVIGALIGTEATLGIIPTGTRNNVAFNLGITGEITGAVKLLRRGRRLKIDVGRVHRGHTRHWFLEAAALGLISDLYPHADDLQHGDLGQLGGLLTTLVSATPSDLKLNLDGEQHLVTSTHMLLVANMAFLGPRFQISPEVSCRDGRLDVFTFPEMSKLQIISYAMLSRAGSQASEAGIRHYRAKEIRISTEPHMPILADGTLLGEGALSIQVHPHALRVLAGAELTGQPAATVETPPPALPDEN